MDFLIGYDLDNKNIDRDKDYDELDDFLCKLGAERVLLSQWAITTDMGAEKLFNLLWSTSYIGDVVRRKRVNDRLLVSVLPSDNFKVGGTPVVPVVARNLLKNEIIKSRKKGG